MTIIRIRDIDTHDGNYDLFATLPDGKTADETVKIIDDAVVQVRTAAPETYNVDDLADALGASGITLVDIVDANELF